MIKYAHIKVVGRTPGWCVCRSQQRGHVTVAYEVEGTKLTMALAWCSPNDQFSKKVGRAISSGRLERGVGYLEVDLTEDRYDQLSEYEVINDNLYWLRLASTLVPRWARI